MTEVDDAHISVRFKHGIHTIYLFVDAQAPFSDISTELVECLRERYPDGLTTSIAPPKSVTLAENAKLVYGVLNVPNDVSRGWKKLNTANGESSPTKLNLKNNSMVAFAVVDDEDEEVVFEVEWPREDEDLYEA